MGRVKVKKIKITNNKINSKIVLISDIHYYSKSDIDKLNLVLSSIKKINPEYICVLGDICDQAKVLDEDVLVNWVKELSLISKVIMVYGNHDVILYSNYSPCFNKKLFNKIKNIPNLYLLDNKIMEENGICFIGIKLDYDYYYKSHENEIIFINHYNKIIKRLDNKKFNILLSHSPIALVKDTTLNMLNDYSSLDLALCGHMHGGITPEVLRPILKTRGAPFMI